MAKILKVLKNGQFESIKPTQTVYLANTLLEKFKLVLSNAGMCKETLFINLNNLVVSFSQSVGQKF